MNLKSAARRIKYMLGHPWLYGRIAAKWRRDGKALPLTGDHRELYEIIHHHFWKKTREFPELVNCRDFNDRMQWLKLFDQDAGMVRCSDKLLVRDYVRERVGDKHLVKLYQVHDHFSEIDFAALPDAFVIKTNHDSGSVILVRDKSQLDKVAAAERIESALRKRYGWTNGEWAYAYIRPKVFVEEFIEPQQTRAPADYKFYVVDGEVKFCHYIYDRGIDPKQQAIDRDGNDLGVALYPRFKLGNAFDKPAAWDGMVRIAEALGQGYKCVRVDLYCTSTQDIYAGEMTFWPMAGVYPGEGQKVLGQRLTFDRSSFKPPVLPALDREKVGR